MIITLASEFNPEKNLDEQIKSLRNPDSVYTKPDYDALQARLDDVLKKYNLDNISKDLDLPKLSEKNVRVLDEANT